MQDQASSLTEWFRFAIAGGLTLFMSGTVAFIIRRQLRAVLRLVCGSDIGADFWTVFTTVLVVFGPLLLVSSASRDTEDLPQFVQHIISLISLGIIGAFMAMGCAVMLSAPSQALAKRRAAQIASEGVQDDGASPSTKGR